MFRRGHGQSRYVCPICGEIEYRAGVFQLVSEESRLYKGQEVRLPEYCTHHTDSMVEMVWTPESSAHDLLGDSFVIDLGDGPKRISSLSELRAIERDSESRHRNKEGSLSIFRDFSQNHSNQGVNTLAGSSYETSKSERINPSDRRTQSGLPLSVRALTNPD